MALPLSVVGWSAVCNCGVSSESAKYCKFGNFRENFIFENSVKRHICDVKNSRLSHDLHISVNDRVISPFREDLIFTFAKIKPSRKFPNLQCSKHL